MTTRRIYLSDRSLMILCIVMCMGVLGILSPAWLMLFSAVLLLFVLATASDRFSLPGAGSFAFQMRAPVYLELENEYSLPLEGQISAGNPPEYLQIHCSEHITPLRTKERCSFAAGKVTGIAVVRGSRLGFATIRSVTAWVPSRLGLWLLGQEVPLEDAEFRVLPKRAEIPADRFKETISRQLAALQGDRRLVKATSPDLYHSSRPYRYPDPLRFMDRKKSAKYGEMYTKCFDSLQEHHVVIALDLGRALCGSVGISSKHDYYLSCALALSEHAIKNRDSVSIIGFSDRMHLLKHRCRSRDGLAELYRGAEAVRPREVASDYELLLKVVQRVASQRSIVIILTDAALSSIQESLFGAFQQLSRKHLCVALTMIENRYDVTTRIAELEPEHLTESEHLSLLYSYAITDRMRVFAQRLGYHGASSVNVPQDYWLSATIKVFDTLRHSLNM